MNLFNKHKIELSDQLVLNTIVSVEELSDHDMIYIYHHLKIGDSVDLNAEGTNVKGDLRYRVSYKNFNLGYITLGSPIKSIYKNTPTLTSEIVHMEKKKFLPVHAIDLSLQATKLKMVS